MAKARSTMKSRSKPNWFSLANWYEQFKCQPEAKMQLNEEVICVQPGDCVMIRPGTRHRAIGRMKVLIIVYPKFDETDEWFD